MPKNTPRVNKHPKTGKVLNNPPKIKHEEVKKNENDYPLIDHDKRGYLEAIKELENINKEVEKRKDANINKTIANENKIMIVIPIILLFGPFINSLLSGCIAYFFAKDIDNKEGVKNLYIFIAFLEIFIPIIFYFSKQLV